MVITVSKVIVETCFVALSLNLTNMHTSAIHIHHLVITLMVDFFQFANTLRSLDSHFLGMVHLSVRTAVVVFSFGIASMELSCKHILYIRDMYLLWQQLLVIIGCFLLVLMVRYCVLYLSILVTHSYSSLKLKFAAYVGI